VSRSRDRAKREADHSVVDGSDRTSRRLSEAVLVEVRGANWPDLTPALLEKLREDLDNDAPRRCEARLCSFHAAEKLEASVGVGVNHPPTERAKSAIRKGRAGASTDSSLSAIRPMQVRSAPRIAPRRRSSS